MQSSAGASNTSWLGNTFSGGELDKWELGQAALEPATNGL